MDKSEGIKSFPKWFDSQYGLKKEIKQASWENNIEITRWASDPSPESDKLSYSIVSNTPTMAINPKNKTMKLTIGSRNMNGLSGIVIQRPNGGFLNSVNVTVSSVKVTDVTDLDNPRELPGVGSEIAGKALTDLDNGIVMNLPASNAKGYIRYRIDLKLEASKQEFDFIAPYPLFTNRCIVGIKLARK